MDGDYADLIADSSQLIVKTGAQFVGYQFWFKSKSYHTTEQCQTVETVVWTKSYFNVMRCLIITQKVTNSLILWKAAAQQELKESLPYANGSFV